MTRRPSKTSRKSLCLWILLVGTMKTNGVDSLKDTGIEGNLLRLLASYWLFPTNSSNRASKKSGSIGIKTVIWFPFVSQLLAIDDFLISLFEFEEMIFRIFDVVAFRKTWVMKNAIVKFSFELFKIANDFQKITATVWTNCTDRNAEI